MSYPNLQILFAKASRLLKSRRLLTLKISVLIFGFVFSSQLNSSDESFVSNLLCCL